MDAYHAVPAAQYRPLALGGGLALCGVLVLLALAIGWWGMADAFLGLALLTPLAYFVVHGAATRSYLFQHVRQYVLDFAPLDWVKAAGGLLVFALILAVFGLFWTWIFVGVFAVGIALAIHFVLDRLIARERRPALAEIERITRGLRLRGISEAAIQKFVCQYAGERWEEPFEEMFGYEAKLAARAKWGDGPKGDAATLRRLARLGGALDRRPAARPAGGEGTASARGSRAGGAGRRGDAAGRGAAAGGGVG